MNSLRQKAKKSVGRSSKYELNRSGFFRLERRSDLAALLQISPDKLSELLGAREDLYSERTEEVNGKPRDLQVPQGPMRRCHNRMLSLLRRIKLPEYIMSPRRGVAAWHNAGMHRAADFITTFDIRKFYPSTTEEHVFRLFKYKFFASDDCSRILAQLCTFKGFLPQGSPASPHLACLVHLDLFEDAAQICTNSGNKLSVWVDDVVISGAAPRRDIVGSIKARAKGKGLQTHKYKRGGGQRGIELTGSFVRGGSQSVANSSHVKIRETRKELDTATDPAERYRIFNRLASMTRYQRTVIGSSGGNVDRLNGRLNYYKREMQKLTKLLSTTPASVTAVEAGLSEEGEAF